jgi:hypothetical protein
VLIFAGAYSIFASFNGSIIKKVITTSKIEDYVAKNYPGQPYEVGFCQYDFKCMMYFCNVQSSESEDTSFTVWDSSDGLIDDYERSVTGRENTMLRLSIALGDYAEELLKRIYPHRTLLVMCESSDTVIEKDVAGLTLDMPFDAKSFPISTTLTVWVETSGDKPTWEELAQRFRELEELIREELPSVEYYTIYLQDKYIEEDGELKPVDYNFEVCAFNVPRNVITSDGLETYLSEVRVAQDTEKEVIEKGESTGK